MAHDGKPFARFFFIEDPDGYKIEVLQRSGRFRSYGTAVIQSHDGLASTLA